MHQIRPFSGGIVSKHTLPLENSAWGDHRAKVLNLKWIWNLDNHFISALDLQLHDNGSWWLLNHKVSYGLSNLLNRRAFSLSQSLNLMYFGKNQYFLVCYSHEKIGVWNLKLLRHDNLHSFLFYPKKRACVTRIFPKKNRIVIFTFFHINYANHYIMLP